MSESPLHPRPRLTRAQWIDLNGPWQFAYDDADCGRDERWQEDAARFERIIQVPFPPESALSGIGDTSFHPVVWYRRTVIVSKPEKGRLLLHFGAVDYLAQVWVNGELVATHEGGHTPFSSDITASLAASGEQVIVVRAEDQPEDVTQPRGKQDWQAEPHAIWYNRTTGIWQPVWLEPVPDTHIASLQLTPDLANGSVHVEARFNRPTTAWLELALSLDGAPLATQRVQADGISLSTAVTISALHNGVDRDRLLWTPDRPKLVDVAVALLDPDGAKSDAIASYVGLRSVGIGAGRLLLNDKPIFMRSVLEQGYWPQSHLAAPDGDALRREVELIKSLGFNAVRIHQKIEDPRFLYWTDRLGLMVWGEIANAYAYDTQAAGRLTREWLAAVERDRSHPSIIAWVPINESWGVTDVALRPEQRAFASALYSLTKAIEPTRPVISNDGWEHTTSDIIGIHDYTEHAVHLAAHYGEAAALAETLTGMAPARRRLLLEPADSRGQPVMLTEFGGLSYRPQNGQAWHGYGTVETADEYLAAMRALFDAIYASPVLAGFCYTQLTDTLQETNGLLDENRAPKLPVEKLREIILQPSIAVPTDFLDLARRKAAPT